MVDRNIRLRPARVGDASVLAELVDYAGEGLPSYLWAKLAAPNETASEVGQSRAARETGSFSYRNATIIEQEGHVAGALIGYSIPEAPEPIEPDMPAMFVPLQELENLAPGTWYVNVLAILPEYRSAGLGTALLEFAEKTAQKLRHHGLSVIVSDSNVGARRLYERLGYREQARRKMVKEDWVNDGMEWELLKKVL